MDEKIKAQLEILSTVLYQIEIEIEQIDRAIDRGEPFRELDAEKEALGRIYEWVQGIESDLEKKL
ncbi:MAG TPA: hypothetical protein ENK52_01050 [Saprospiraceae bacterium]|nr:hypothetical protein [Saprospiraceae bacterium]